MFRRWFFNSLLFALFVAVVLFAIRDLSERPKTNVILLTVESTRYDAINSELTPAIWQLAKKGTYFRNHRTASAWTSANIASILTGASVFHHGIHSHGVSAVPDIPRPLDLMSAQGWHVAGLQPFMLIDGFQNLGLSVQPNAALMPWLAQQRKARDPFFLWYHYLDTHLPYAAAPLDATSPADASTGIESVRTLPAIPAGTVQFQDRDLPLIRQAYDEQFREFDKWFVDLWTFLEKSGLRKDTIIVLTTDHGEELLERGQVGHASTTRAGHLYEEIVHVPLIVWLPPGLDKQQPQTIDRLSSHIDLMPTLLELIGLNSSVSPESRNLFALPKHRVWSAITSKAGFAEEDPANVNNFVAAIKDGPIKLHATIENRGLVDSKLFDLQADPREEHDISSQRPQDYQQLKARLLEQIKTMAVARPASGSANAAAQAPQWIYPAGSRTVRFDDLPQPLQLQWRGEPSLTYKLQYQAGQGPTALKGELSIKGTMRDFGTVERDYWISYVVPYKTIRLRVGQNTLWSPWVTVEVRE